MIYINEKNFVLGTENTTYAFRVTEEGLLEHLFYGAGIDFCDDMGASVLTDCFRAMTEKVSHAKGTTVNYRKDSLTVEEDMCLEMSSSGKGDYREPFVLISYPDGSRTSDFIYESYEICDEVGEPKGMPGAIPGDRAGAQQLKLVLKERVNPVRLELYYTVFPECDVITRHAVLMNCGSDSIRIRRLMSMQLDLDETGYRVITFGGNWGREMMKHESVLTHGMLVNRSLAGVSSNRANPFVMLAEDDTTERAGDCYAFNLIYSGNHFEAAECSGFYKTRFLAGIDPTEFDFELPGGESFMTPQGVMTFSDAGFEGISRHMHSFVRDHIVRGRHAHKTRPVLLNSWEAAYFNISENRLLSLAKKAKDAGVELLVMDDGWFKGRNNDKSSLGDWTPDTKKLPGGVARLAEKIHETGLMFGIWVEPEMISEDSDIYRAHPEYAMSVPGRDCSPGRNQLLLDLTNPAVVEYVKSSMRQVFTEGKPDYVKWDMNRMVGDYFSKVLPAERQGETAHRWVLGLYDIMGTLVKEFPDILFEGCSSGGNRFDLGILSFMPQIWGSDDTDAMMRTKIQTGYSYGYPMSTVTAHVSGCPNHQTLRNTPLETRFNIAMFGVLGYELNLCECSSEEFDAIKAQIALYKQWRDVLQWGDFYRVGEKEWITVSPDRSKAVCVAWNELCEPNNFYLKLKTHGLDDNKLYHIYNIQEKIDIKQFGSLVNQLAPIHVKQDSLVHNVIAKFVKMDGESEDYRVPGRLLNSAGIKLAQAFGGSGFEGQTRLYQDFASRVYFIEEVI